MATENVLHLDARLRAAAQLVRRGHRAADIGCDHGKLSAALVCSGRCPFVVAADLRPGPLSVARANMEAAGCAGKVDLRLGNGLEVVRPGEAEDIIIAGMGAETICEILEAAPWVKDPAVRLILVPATKHSILRRWLCRQGFELKEEKLARVGSRWYAVMAAEYTGKPFEPEGRFCLLGLAQGLEGWQEYLKQQLVKLKKFSRGVEQDPALAGPVAALVEELEGLLKE
ncbi:MAG: SAM-dependent methyltransferase [Oscillospiraceae bacterium]|nr:SAM-dependent methyltransferase [Oscillospiraceae bacterium]